MNLWIQSSHKKESQRVQLNPSIQNKVKKYNDSFFVNTYLYIKLRFDNWFKLIL